MMMKNLPIVPRFATRGVLAILAAAGVALAGCASEGNASFTSFVEDSPFGTSQRADCSDFGFLTSESVCTRVILDDPDALTVSDVVDMVRKQTGTPAEHTVCSQLPLPGDFNCVFFGAPDGGVWPVLHVGMRAGGVDVHMEVSTSTSGLSPDELRGIVESTGPLIELD